ncbi:hypothetical protein HK100_007223 [Physocladia obscura]|uniref:non-specific serine/threonine protein kinase n=1 Tax=Physocladia obscura TaxID=109957 RepID=A0AAD5XB96_9FUNG|nr:hypothetical protein HK100_007223 [Physocladia obscura]
MLGLDDFDVVPETPAASQQPEYRKKKPRFENSTMGRNETTNERTRIPAVPSKVSGDFEDSSKLNLSPKTLNSRRTKSQAISNVSEHVSELPLAFDPSQETDDAETDLLQAMVNNGCHKLEQAIGEFELQNPVQCDPDRLVGYGQDVGAGVEIPDANISSVINRLEEQLEHHEVQHNLSEKLTNSKIKNSQTPLTISSVARNIIFPANHADSSLFPPKRPSKNKTAKITHFANIIRATASSPQPTSTPENFSVILSQQSLSISVAATPKLPQCMHLTFAEHDSCTDDRKCKWRNQTTAIQTHPPSSREKFITSHKQSCEYPTIAILEKPFSRAANVLLRHLTGPKNWSTQTPTMVREALMSLTGNGVAEKYGKRHSCNNPRHAFANDMKDEYVDDYVAHWCEWWSAREDEKADDGYVCTRDVEVRDEVYELYGGFRGLFDTYRILDKIGEGTFSSVYQAVDRLHDEHINSWCACFEESEKRGLPNESSPQNSEQSNRWAACGVVALKRIYVTSSTDRILNELSMLKNLAKKPNVAGLITAIRNKDQIIAVLPLYEFVDFRDFLTSDPSFEELSFYMKALMIGLRGIHEENILHRDIKPTNFLYNRALRTGVIVDFGLAQIIPPSTASTDPMIAPPPNPRPAGYFETDKRFDQIFPIKKTL